MRQDSQIMQSNFGLAAENFEQRKRNQTAPRLHNMNTTSKTETIVDIQDRTTAKIISDRNHENIEFPRPANGPERLPLDATSPV